MLGSNKMLYHQPLVSVCIPTYNTEKTVLNTLQSILNQTYPNMEIIVVDNASTDNTLSLLQQINDSKLVIYRNERNIGAVANSSKCIDLATGEYIAIFHADDLYLPDMVEKEVRTFQHNPSIGAVFTMAKRINERGEAIGETMLPVKLKGKSVYYFPEIFINLLENGNFLMCSSCMVRGKLYKELAPFDSERFGTSADLDMWLRILRICPVAVLEEKLMGYRVSDASWSYRSKYTQTEESDSFKVMDYHLSVESNVLNIPRSVLNKYEFQRSLDKIMRAINNLGKREVQEAKRLLRESLSPTAFHGAVQSSARPKLVAFWICGILLLFSGPMIRYIAASLRWLLHKQKRRITCVSRPKM